MLSPANAIPCWIVKADGEQFTFAFAFLAAADSSSSANNAWISITESSIYVLDRQNEWGTCGNHNRCSHRSESYAGGENHSAVQGEGGDV